MRSRVLLFIAALVVIASVSAASDDWPMVRHDAQNTGYTSQEVAPPLRLAWRTKVKGTPILESGGVVCIASDWPSKDSPRATLIGASNGRHLATIEGTAPLYLEGSTIILLKVESRTGASIQLLDWRKNEVKWSHPLKGVPDGPPGSIVYGDSVYCVCRVSPPELIRLSLSDGTMLGEHAYDGFVTGSPAASGENVFWATGHWLHVLKADDLEPRKAYYDGGDTYPLFVKDVVIAQGWGHWVSATRVTDSRRLWSFRAWRGAAHCLARGPGGATVVVESSASPQELAAIDTESGKVVWRYPLFVGGYGSGWLQESSFCAGTDRFVYAPGWHEHLPGQKVPRGGFYCLDGATGKLVWKYERMNMQGQCVIVSDGALYALDSGGYLCKFVPQGKQTSKRKLSGLR